MNRTERRQAIKQGITANKLYKILQQERLKTIQSTVEKYSMAVAMILYDKLEFDKEMIITTLQQIEDLFDSILKNYLSIDDIKNTLKEEIGIEFEEGERLK